MLLEFPQSVTEQYIDNSVRRYKYTGLLNANFQDYLAALEQGGRYTLKSHNLVNKASAIGSALGMGAGALGGPAGIALGFAVGSSIGKYVGNVFSERIYGRAIADMNEINYEAKTRHPQLAASLAFTNEVDSAIDTLRQNQNKRIKDALQSMQV